MPKGRYGVDSLIKKLAKNLFISGNHLDEIGLVSEANKVSDVLSNLLKKAQEDGEYEGLSAEEIDSGFSKKTVDEIMEDFRLLSEEEKDRLLAEIIQELDYSDSNEE
jgi:hypothetical protein